MTVLDSRDDVLRIGDRERTAAVEALGQHLRDGRIDPHEYSERVEACTLARTAAELAPSFADLPWPSPFRLRPVSTPDAVRAEAPASDGPVRFARVGQVVLNTITVLALIVLAAPFVALGIGLGPAFWWVLLLFPFAVAACGGRPGRPGHRRYQGRDRDRRDLGRHYRRCDRFRPGGRPWG